MLTSCRFTSCFILALLTTTPFAAVAAGPVPEVQAVVCAQPPVIDGKLDDACWKDAAAVETFHRLAASASGEGITQATRFRIAADNRWLYLALSCDNPDMPRLEIKRPEHDGPVQEDDSVEIFLDPGSDGELYYHYLLSFANARGERRVVKGDRQIDWDIPWRSATHRRPDGWDAEIGIPLYILCGHGDLNKARLNIGRNMVTFGFDGIGERTVRQKDWSSWSPLKHGFHEPDRFGSLKGLGDLKIEPPFLPGLLMAEVTPYEVAADARQYGVKCMVRDYTVVPGQAKLAIVDSPVAGETRTLDRLIDVPPMKTTPFQVEVLVTGLAQRNVTATLVDPDSGEVWQTYGIADTRVLSLMDDPLADRNIYTIEKTAGIRCGFGLPRDLLAEHRLVARDARGRELCMVKQVEPETLVRVPLSDLAAGSNAVTIALEDAAGQLVTRKPVTLVKKAPPPNGEVAIDRLNRVVLHNGEPCMPFGIMFSTDARGEEAFAQHMKWVAEMGFNSIVSWGATNPEKAKKDIQLAQSHDLLFIDSLGHYLDRGERTEAGIEKIAAGINAVKDSPNLLAYYSLDEPNLVANHIGSFDKAMAECELMYKTVNELDGCRPVVMLYARDIPPEKSATMWSEILGYDIYLTGGMQSFYAGPEFMASFVAQLDRRAAEVHQVTWVVPLAERLDPWRTPRALLPDEHRSQAYIAVINGAKGFLYFCYSGISHIWTRNVLTELAAQMKSLAPAITAPPVPQSIEYEPGICDPANRKFTDVQARLFRYPDGRTVLLAANIRYFPVDVTFTISGLGQGAAVRRLFSDESRAVKDSSFSDQIEWCGVRAYELPLPAKGAPIGIQVHLTPHPEQEVRMTRYNPSTVCKGKKNLVPNPSFEVRQLPDLPDYVTPYRHEGRPAIGQEGALLATDTNNPFHGSVSLRVTRRIEGTGNICWGFFDIAYPGPLDGPSQFVLSMYLRGQKDGDKLWVRIDGMTPGEKTFAVTAEWQRYSMSGTLSSDRWPHRGILFAPTPDESTIWIDALQFEPGVEPTEFTTQQE